MTPAALAPARGQTLIYALNWLDSYSLYEDTLKGWLVENVAEDWPDQRARAMDILQQEAELQDIVQLVGSDALPPEQQLTLEVARLYREVFLQQNAFHPVDTFSSMDKSYKLLKAIDQFNTLATAAMGQGAQLKQILETQAKNDLAKARYEEDFDGAYQAVLTKMEQEFGALGGP